MRGRRMGMGMGHGEQAAAIVRAATRPANVTVKGAREVSRLFLLVVQFGLGGGI